MTITGNLSARGAAFAAAGALRKPGEGWPTSVRFYPYQERCGGLLCLIDDTKDGPRTQNYSIDPIAVGWRVRFLKDRPLVVARLESQWYEQEHVAAETARLLAETLIERWSDGTNEA